MMICLTARGLPSMSSRTASIAKFFIEDRHRRDARNATTVLPNGWQNCSWDGKANVAREVAFHYEAADNWQHAVTALRAAARHAKQRKAYAEAADLLGHALRIAENLEPAGSAKLTREMLGELAIVREQHNDVGVLNGLQKA